MAEITAIPVVPDYFRGHMMYMPPPKGEASQYKNQKEWQQRLCRESLEYAIARLNRGRVRQINKINNLYNSYIGLVNEDAYTWLQKTYGAMGIALYHDYRLSKTKLDQLQGEWLERPLSSTVYCINADARSQVLEDYTTLVGLKYSAEQVQKLKTMVGVDPANGVQPPPMTQSDDDIWKGVSSKRENTFIMQEILNKVIEKENVKMKLAENLSDVSIAAECFGKVYLDEHGFTRYRDIDPRYALFEETSRDPFLFRSPYLGERRPLYIHEIYTNWTLPESSQAYLQEMVKEYKNNIDGDWTFKRYYTPINETFTIDTYTIEWFAAKPYYFKKTKDRVTMMDFDYYNMNQKKINGEVKKGMYDIDVRYKLVTWEASKIGHRMYIKCQEKENMPLDMENPYETLRSYGGLLFNTKNGIRVSLQQATQHLNKLYNIVMFQIQREISKYKGKVLPLDRSMYPKGKKTKDILSKITNDGILDYNSAADGNEGGRDMDMRETLKEIDMGLSASMVELRALKTDIERTVDLLTGINGPRQGQTQASQPLGSQNNDLNQSFSITEPFSFMFNEYTEQVFYKMMMFGKVTYGLLHPDKGAMLLGDSGLKYLKDTSSIAFEDYGLYISDGRREKQVRELMHEYLPQAINAKELRVVDAVQAELAETMDKTLAILNHGWDVVQDIAQKQTQGEQQARAADTQSKNQAMLAAQDKELQGKIDQRILDGLIKMGLLTQEAKNIFLQDEAQRQHEKEQNTVDLGADNQETAPLMQ